MPQPQGCGVASATPPTELRKVLYSHRSGVTFLPGTSSPETFKRPMLWQCSDGSGLPKLAA
jgi:hypothetical protein